MSMQGFIVISNFGVDEDSLTSEFREVVTGLSGQEFFSEISVLAKPLDLQCVDFFDDTLVLTGTAEDRAYLEKKFGDKFSYAFIGETGLAEMRAYFDGTVDQETAYPYPQGQTRQFNA